MRRPICRRRIYSRGVRYREHIPCVRLQPFVECLWSIAGDGDPSDVDAGMILPDGCVEVVVSAADPVQRAGDGARLSRFVVGPMRTWTRVAYGRAVDLVGIRIRPGAGSALLGTPPVELAERILNVEDLDARLDRELGSVLETRGGDAERFAAIERLLMGRMECRFEQDPLVASAVARVERSRGRVSVGALASEFGLSARQLERRFARSVGLGPKHLCRIMRFRRAFEAALAAPAPDWPAIAQDCGYFDQAHLIHDFRQLAGRTPSAILA